jgi:predicted RNase H-like nuclease (RuvC/YqgF family)
MENNMDYERRTTDAKLNRLEVEVSALKEKISFFNVIYQKFDDTLDKVQKMMEDRRNETNHDLKDVYSKITEVETKIMDEIHSMRDDMKKQHELERAKIADLDKWRWMVVGAAAIVSWVISQFSGFIK